MNGWDFLKMLIGSHRIMHEALGQRLYYHPKTGNVYQLLWRFQAGKAYLETDKNFYLSASAADSIYVAAVGDPIEKGQEAVLYRNILTDNYYIRLASKFDEQERYVSLEMA